MPKECYGELRYTMRTDTAKNWEMLNPVLLSGEMGISICEDGTKVFKIGDGVHAWKELAVWTTPENKNYSLTDKDKTDLMGLAMSALSEGTTFIFDGGDASGNGKKIGIDIVIDGAMSDNSENLVPNKVIKQYVDDNVKLYILDSRTNRHDTTKLVDTQAMALMQIRVDGEYRNLLIDCGDYDLAETHIETLNELGVKKIDYIYITHYHYDHVGLLTYFHKKTQELEDMGILDSVCPLSDKLDIRGATIFLPENPPTTYTNVDAYINIVSTVVEKFGLEKKIPADVGAIHNIGSLKLDFRNCDTSSYYEGTVDYNNTSLCCIMTFGETRIGFFGDINVAAQEKLAGTIGYLDLMNVEHHGINQTHCEDFYSSIAPKMCFTQDAEGHGVNEDKNGVRYKYAHILSGIKYDGGLRNHPSHDYLLKNNIPNYAVSRNGTILFNISKTGITTMAMAERDFEKIYPVGSVYIENNSEGNPEKRYGGTWERIDKGFRNESIYTADILSTECFTPDTGASIVGGSLYIGKSGTTIRIRVGIVTEKTFTDKEHIVLGKLNFEKFGITQMPAGFFGIMASSDYANGGVLIAVNYETGIITADDVIGAESVTTIYNGTYQPIYLDMTFNVAPTLMLDEFCDKFYWRRTS